MKNIRVFTLFVFLFFVLSLFLTPHSVKAQENPLDKMLGSTYYLGCNLHVDPGRTKLSSINYQLQGHLLTWGTKIRVVEVLRNKIKIRNMKTNKDYYYEFHWRTRKATPLPTHLKRIFVNDISSVEKTVEGMSKKDKEGIYKGKVMVGMTKKAVLVAIGYPPEFATADPMNERQWHYWRKRYKKFHVLFDNNGLVYEIAGSYS